MAQGTRFEIVSPERLLVSEVADSVTLPGAEGYLTIMGDHSPLMTTLRPGFITAVTGNTSRTFFVRGGFADISPEGLTVLAEDARDAAEFDRTEVEAMIAEQQAQADSAATVEEKAVHQNEADTWRNLLLEVNGTAGGTH
jgi:F-type H+-transporting ATPase subunit epsilon